MISKRLHTLHCSGKMPVGWLARLFESFGRHQVNIREIALAPSASEPAVMRLRLVCELDEAGELPEDIRRDIDAVLTSY